MRHGIVSKMAVLVLGLAAAPGFARAASGFNVKSISGGYSLRMSGWDMATPTTPVSMIGNLSANRGTLSGNVMINDGGVNCVTSFSTGSVYTVNQDGTGSMTLILNGSGASCSTGTLPLGSMVVNFTIVNNGYAIDLGARTTSPATIVLSGNATFQGKIK